MKKNLFYLFAAALLLTGCSTVAMTGRKQLMLVDHSEVLTSSLTYYQEVIGSVQVEKSTTRSTQVERVGKKIAAATEEYLRNNGAADQVSEFAWEFNLVQDDQANAFCMPGGKIVVYTGILKYATSDDELAVVLGHEVAHAVARHSDERMSQQVAAQYGSNILSSVLSGKSESVQLLASQVYGLGAQYGVMLPFSRKHETEADYMGLVLMSMAGYNPDCAITFWQKMSSGGQSVPEFMSTHPSDATRISNINEKLAEVKAKYYKPATTTTNTKTTKTTKTSKSSSSKKSTKK